MNHYVYKYVLNGEILYIGKTDGVLSRRLKQHGRKGDNIASEYWDEINKCDIYYESNLSGILAEQSLRMVIVLLRNLKREEKNNGENLSEQKCQS